MTNQPSVVLPRRSVGRHRGDVGHTLGRLVQDRGGAVLIEMSIVLLILVMILIGVTELSQALTLQRRVVTAAASAADLMTRADRPLGVGSLKVIKEVLEEIVGPNKVVRKNGKGEDVSLFGFKVTVFTVKLVEKEKQVTATGSYTCDVSGLKTPLVPNDIVKEVEVGGRVIVAETRLKFTSSFAFFIKDIITLQGTSYFIPRLGSQLTLGRNETCPVA